MPGPFHTLDTICARRQALIYVSSPVCEVDFSSSGEPSIVLNPFRRRRGPTGLIVISGGRLRFRWNTSDGAICYSLYRREGGEYVLVAGCIPCEACVPPTEDECCYECEEGDCPPGCYAITAITADGETEPSEEVCIGSEDECSVTIITDSLLPSGAFNQPYSQQLDQEFGLESTEQWAVIAGALPAGLSLSTSGLISGIPTEGGNFSFTVNVFAMCTETLGGEDFKEFFLNVAGGPPTCNFRVADYGGTQPFFIPNPAAPDSSDPEWNGTVNFFVSSGSTPTDTYFYRGSNGEFLFPNVSIGGKQVIEVVLTGPFPPDDDNPDTRWLFQINDPGATGYLVWFGIKSGGDISTPAGLYVVSSFGGGDGTGSDLRGTVFIEECPPA